VLRIRVDLVRPNRALAVVALHRRVDLEGTFARQRRLLGLVLLLVERADRGMRIVVADRLAELAVDREAATDAMRRAIRPDEHPVGTPHLDADDVGLPAQLLLDLPRQVRRDMHSVAAHELRPQHAVDVLRQPGPLVVEHLPAQRSRQDGAEHQPPETRMTALASRKTRSSVSERFTAQPRDTPVATREDISSSAALSAERRIPLRGPT
jgi:hypothetical protein